MDPDGRDIIDDIGTAVKEVWEKISNEFSIPSKNEHFSRNDSNIDIGTNWQSADKLATEKKVIKMSEGKDCYHEQGTAKDYNPALNDKFVTLDGKNETVYNSETGEKITDPVNQGTYNFANPNANPIGHFFKDMIPYYLWGNSPDDPTTVFERITGSYKGDVNATKKEAAQFRAEQNEENRNKAMEMYYEHH